MKKIFGLTIAAVLVMAMVTGGTWAYFSDTESSTNNSLTAGTLDLNIIEALGKFGDKARAAVPELVRIATKAKRKDVRDAAIKAIDLIGHGPD